MTATGEVPLTDEQDCARERGRVGQEPGADGVLALVVGACGAECAEGGGVAAALGREVPPESEHVRPRGEAQVCKFGELTQAQALGDQAAGVSGDGQGCEAVGGSDAPVEGAGALSRLGGVLGNVPGDLGIGEFPAGGDGPDVVLAAPGESPGREARGGRRADTDVAERLSDGVVEQVCGGPVRRGCGGAVWALGPGKMEE